MTKGPLDGVKVLDISLMFPGPLCSMYLGDMGADVIKVEHPHIGDFVRQMGEQVINKDKSSGTSGIYLMVNRNKKSLSLNIKKKKGRQILLQLLENTDIFIEGFRHGTLQKLGLDYEKIKKKFPKLIYCHISAYGNSGPYKNLSGHDANFLATSGALDLIGEKDRSPTLPCFQIGSLAGGSLILLSSVLAALYSREKTGKGQFLDIGMLDGTFSLLPTILGDYIATKKPPSKSDTILSGKLGNYSVYQCKDKKYVTLASLEPQFLTAFFKKIGREDLLNKYSSKNYQKLIELKLILTNIFKTKTRDEWTELFQDINACLTPVKTLAEALEDPHLKEREMIQTIPHPDFGDLLMIGSPFKFSNTPCTYRKHPPNLGEHTKEILSKNLGLTQSEIDLLQQNKIV